MYSGFSRWKLQSKWTFTVRVECMGVMEEPSCTGIGCCSSLMRLWDVDWLQQVEPAESTGFPVVLQIERVSKV